MVRGRRGHSSALLCICRAGLHAVCATLHVLACGLLFRWLEVSLFCKQGMQECSSVFELRPASAGMYGCAQTTRTTGAGAPAWPRSCPSSRGSRHGACARSHSQKLRRLPLLAVLHAWHGAHACICQPRIMPPHACSACARALGSIQQLRVRDGWCAAAGAGFAAASSTRTS